MCARAEFAARFVDGLAVDHLLDELLAALARDGVVERDLPRFRLEVLSGSPVVGVSLFLYGLCGLRGGVCVGGRGVDIVRARWEHSGSKVRAV